MNSELISRIFEWIAKLALSAPTGLLLNSYQRKRVYINNKVVPNSILGRYGAYIISCGLVIITVCWRSIAMVDVIYSCDTDKRDCFATTKNETATPVTNCSDYSSTEDVQIECYWRPWNCNWSCWWTADIYKLAIYKRTFTILFMVLF